MPRIPRVVVLGLPHHITQRGNRREAVFFDDRDRQHYLELLATCAARAGLAIHAYCLMTNHVHLVAVPAAEQSLADCLGPLHLRYAQHINRTQRLGGRLWQGRYFSCPLDDAHYSEAVRYVELNPVRAGLVGQADKYPWSSAAAHVAGTAGELLADVASLREAVGDWSAWLREPLDQGRVTTIRQRTMTGRPAGDSAFVAQMSERLGRALATRGRGRPRKQEEGK